MLHSELITRSGDNHMWSCSIAQGHNLLSTQDINPARLNSALKVSEPQTAAAVGA